jgi:predicted lysophospholipase L1 biosynthesis ABC-type transport system permease subunit
MSLQFERSREIGVLRATGDDTAAVVATLAAAGLIGAVAGLLAMPTGYLLAVILIYIINLRSVAGSTRWSLCRRSCAGGGAAGRRLPVEDRQYPAGDCGAVGVTNS